MNKRFCPTCGLGFKDDGGLSILSHFASSQAHFVTPEALEAQTALYNYSYAVQAYEQSFYYDQKDSDPEARASSTASPSQIISCNTSSSTSSSTPRHPRNGSSSNSDDLEAPAAAVQVLDKAHGDINRVKLAKKKPAPAPTPTVAPKPFTLKADSYDSAFPSLAGGDSSVAPSAWGKKPIIAPSRKLDVSAPQWTPGAAASVFSSQAVRERRAAAETKPHGDDSDTLSIGKDLKEERGDGSLVIDPKAAEVNVDPGQARGGAMRHKGQAAQRVSEVTQPQGRPGEGGRGGKKPSTSSLRNGYGNGRAQGDGRPRKETADEAVTWRKVSAKGKAN